MTDKSNAEISLKLGDQQFTLRRPSYEIVVAIEKRTGRGIVGMGMRLTTGDLSTIDMAAIIKEAAAEASDFSVADIGCMINDAGRGQAFAAVSEFLLQAVSGKSG